MSAPRGRPFQPGNRFGKGRPKGSRNRNSAEARKLLDECSPHLTRKCIAMAMEGNPHAMRLCMDRIYPARRDAPVAIKLPRIRSAGDVVNAAERVTRGMGKGIVSPSEGEKMMNVLESQSRVIDNAETESRIERLEQHCADADGNQSK